MSKSRYYLLQTSKFNRLFDQIVELNVKLKSQPGNKRRSVRALYQHPSIQVRLNAAYTTLKNFPDDARRVLEIIAAEKSFPQTANASGTLERLDQSKWIPMRGLD